MKSLTKQQVCSTVLPFVVCLGFVITAHARVNIKPSITVDTAYDSNFWLSEDKEVSVQTYSINPSVNLSYETGKTNIGAFFGVHAIWYDSLDDLPLGVSEASDSDYIGYSGGFNGTTDVSDRLTLGLDDNVNFTTDAAEADSLSDSVSRNKYFINSFIPNVYYDFSNKFGIGAAYSNLYIDYSDDGEGSVQNGGNFELYYNLNRRQTFFLSYDVYAKDYDLTSSDYISNKVKLNYNHEFSHFTVDTDVGYHHRIFDQDIESLENLSWNVSIEGKGLRAPMSISLRQDMNDQGAGNAYYVATRLDAVVGYAFVKKLDTRLRGSYQNSSYDIENGVDSDRDDNTYSISALVGYKFLEYGEVILEVGHKARDSSENGLDYEDTFGTLSFDFGFDL